MKKSPTVASFFNFDLNSKLTTITSHKNEVFFLAKEVADILEINRVSNMIRNLDDDECFNITHSQAVAQLVSNGYLEEINSSGMKILTESGFYSCIMGSSKPIAKSFKKWVTSEVLPSIRKTGSYQVNNENKALKELEIDALKDIIDKLVESNKKLLESNLAFERKLSYLAEKIDMKEDFTKLLLPQATGWNYINKATNTISVMDLAKMTYDSFGLGEREMLNKLAELRIFMPNNKGPYQRYINEGHFKVVCNSIGDRMYARTRVTGKGVNWVIKKIAT